MWLKQITISHQVLCLNIYLVKNHQRNFQLNSLLTNVIQYITHVYSQIDYIKSISKSFILPEHLSSPLVFGGVHVTWSLVLCACFEDHCLSFFFWSLCFWFTASDYPLGIFKLSFLNNSNYGVFIVIVSHKNPYTLLIQTKIEDLVDFNSIQFN
jgi:hypothetical protein